MFANIRFASFLVALNLGLSSVSAHGLITTITGANGVAGQGFGVVASTPRDGSSPNPFEQDTSVIRNAAIASGKTGVCGKTAIGGNNDVTAQMAAAVAAGLPTAAADGSVTMTLHQVNQDGAGPYKCVVSADGTGADFVPATVTTNVPGVAGLSGAKATDFPLVAQMPAGIVCKGGPDGNACLVRCTNPALAGPFGGCAAVTNAASASNATVAAAATTAAAGTSAAVASAAASSAVPAAKRRALSSRIVGAAKAGKWI